MVNKSIVAKSNGDLYPKSLEAMTNKFVSPWVVVISLLRSGRLLSVANQSSLPYSESYLRSAQNPFGPTFVFDLTRFMTTSPFESTVANHRYRLTP